MSAVALERQSWWSSNLQDYNSFEPPALPCPHLTQAYPPSLQLNYCTCNCAPNIHASSKCVSRRRSSLYPCRPGTCVTRSTCEPLNRVHYKVKGEDTCAAPPKMHAQVTPGSLALSTIQNITTTTKYESESLGLDPDRLLCSSTTTPSCTITNRFNTAATPSESHHHFDISTSGTTTITTTGTNDTTEGSIGSFSPPQSSNAWKMKSFTKCTTNSRGGLPSKGVCCVRRRLIDEEGYIRRAACICVNEDETQVLLVTSKKDPCVWLVPGGGMEAGEEAITAAQREAWEEAGIQGVMKRFLGLFESYHHSGTKKHRTAVFVFVVTKELKDFPEARLGRRRRWFSLEEALLLLARHRPLQSTYLQLLMMSKLKMAAVS